MPVPGETTCTENGRAWCGTAVLLIVYLLSTGWGFWFQPIVNPDEPRYACAARDMAEGTGSWLVPTFNGEPRLKKPPLIYWSLAVCGKIGMAAGMSVEGAFRIAPLLAGLVTLLSVFGIGRRLFGARAGFLAGLILIATPFIHEQWREIDTDPFLTAGLTAAWYFAIAAIQQLRRSPGKSVWPWLLGAYLCLSLSCLAKGPFLMGIFFVLPALTYILWGRPAQELGFANSSRLLLRTGILWGVPLVLVLGLGWNLLFTEANLTQVRGQEMVHQNINRFLGGVDHNKGLQMYPWLQYLLNLPQQFLPWSLFWLPLVVVAWQRERSRFRICLCALALLVVPALVLRLIGGSAPEKSWQFGPYLAIMIVLLVWTTGVFIHWLRRISPADHHAKLIICTVVIPFLLMGLAGSKRDSYLLPIFPFLALWTAQAWDGMLAGRWAGESISKGLMCAWTVIIGMLCGAAALYPLVLALSGPLGIQEKVGFQFPGGTLTVLSAAGIAMLLGAGWAIRELRAGQRLNATLQAILLVAGALFVHEATLKPALDRREDRRTFYTEVSEVVRKRPLVWFGGTANEAVYYCRRTVKRLLTFAEMEDGFFDLLDAVMVVRDKEFEGQAPAAVDLRASVRELRRLPLGDRVYFLVEANPARSPLPESLKGKPAASDESGE